MGNAAVPDFIQEAVNNLDTPEQGRMLLKLLRLYSSCGPYMSKEKLDELVAKVKNMGNQELTLAVGHGSGGFAAARVTLSGPQIIDVEPEEEVICDVPILTE